MELFPFSYEKIIQRIDEIQPVEYARTRNFIDGQVTRLSPYISRGVVSTKGVLKRVLSQGFTVFESKKLIQELAWRDYWQQVWIAKGEEINEDLRRSQPDVVQYGLPVALLKGSTGIKVIDGALQKFLDTGYLHNHVRMYIASIACSIGKYHWYEPARWMYYHLLDGDWASNALSWQWVAGSNSGKQYIANQENINKYCYSTQKKTFLDVSYEKLLEMSVPSILKQVSHPQWNTPLEIQSPLNVDTRLPTLVYNTYNLDPLWKKDTKANRILLLEPDHFSRYPVSKKVLEFILGLSKNISGMQVFTGSFDQLEAKLDGSKAFFKEHPLSRHYRGQEEPRDWMFSVTGYYPSFSSYWKQCERELVNYTY